MTFKPMHIKKQAKLAEYLEAEMELEVPPQRITQWDVEEGEDINALAQALHDGVKNMERPLFTVLVLDMSE